MLLAVGILLALLIQPVQAGETYYEGRPVVQVMDELRAHGLGLIYNTRSVPDTLRVLQEPRASDPRALLLEILKPHGLGLKPISDNLFAVVELPAASPAGLADSGQTPPAVVSTAPPEEIVVSSSRYVLARARPGSHAVFNREQIENMPRLGDESLRAVQRLPGAAGNGFSGLPRIRGGEENESAIVLNGLTLYEPFHLKNFLGPVSLLDSRLIGSIDVYTGGYTAEYGDLMSAVIDVQTLTPPLPPVANKTNGHYYELGFSLFHTNALASAPFDGGKGGWMVAVRRSNLDLLSKFSEKDYGEPNYFDGFTRVTYQFSPATRLAFNALGSHDEITALTTGGRERSKVDYVNRYMWGELDHIGPGALHSRLIASVTAVNNDRHGNVNDPAGEVGQVADERRFQIFGLRYEGEHEPPDGTSMQHHWGLELRALEARYRYASSAQFAPDYLLPLLSIPAPARGFSRGFDGEPRGNSYAAWWSTRLFPLKDLTAELGVRWDAQSYSLPGLDRQFSPRLNLLYRLNDATSLRASWGRFFQSQGIQELQVEDGVGQFFPAQRADHLIVSLERQLPLQTTLRIELYRKNYSHLRPHFENMFDPLVLLPELESDRVRVAPDTAHVQAIEVLFSRQADGPWNTWVSYSLSRATDRIDGSQVARSWDQRHSVQLGADRTGRYWDFGLAGTWHSGWPFTSPVVVGGAGSASIDIGARNSERLDDFSSLDLRLTRRFALSRGELLASVEVSNALDQKNACCHRYTAQRLPDGSIQLNTSNRNWLPLVPSFSVLWKF